MGRGRGRTDCNPWEIRAIRGSRCPDCGSILAVDACCEGTADRMPSWNPIRSRPVHAVSDSPYFCSRGRPGLPDHPWPAPEARDIGFPYNVTGTGLTRQIFSAYSRIARSEENFPIRATFRIDIRSHCFAER